MVEVKRTNLVGTFNYFTQGRCGMEREQVTLGENGVIAVILDDDGEVVDWITDETPWETAVNFATAGSVVWLWDPRIVWEREQDSTYPHDGRMLHMMIREINLYNDCFGE